MGWMQEGTDTDNQRGVCDGTVDDIPVHDFDDYQKICTTRRLNELGDKHIAVIAKGDIPVSTSRIPMFRITQKQYFKSAQTFYLNWDESDRRLQQAHRYSLPGTYGFYFGLTLDAAFDEAMYYGSGSISDDNMILVVDCFLDNILYLAHPLVLRDVWKKANLDDTTVFDAYIKILSGDSTNEICNRLGMWARKEGFDGLIYPSARYGQQGLLQRAIAERRDVFPVPNFVPIGTKICGYSVEPGMWFHNELIHYLATIENPERTVPIYAEPNVVLFSNRQLTGFDRPIFYWTNQLRQKERVRSADRRSSSKTYTQFAIDENGVASIFYKSPYNLSLYNAPASLVDRLAKDE